MKKSQWKFQCRRLFRSRVINFRPTASIPLFIFLCYFTDFDKNGTSNWKNTKLSVNTSEHSNMPKSKFQCRSFFRLWVIRLCFLLKKLYFYALLRIFIKTEQAIEKSPKFGEVIIGTLTTHNQSFNVLGCLIFGLLGLKVCYTLMWFLKNVPVQGLPLNLKFFFKSWKPTENKVLRIHWTSAIHDFFFRLFFLF